MRLLNYVVKRLLLIIPVLLGVSIIIFTLSRMTGDPAAAYINEKMTEAQILQIYEKYHFDEPISTQYFYWLDGIIHGDWGWSKTAVMPVTEAITTKLPITVELTVFSMMIGTSIGITLGTMTALRKDKMFDHLTRVISLVGVSIPIFWLALIFQYVFYFKLDLLPSTGALRYRFRRQYS